MDHATSNERKNKSAESDNAYAFTNAEKYNIRNDIEIDQILECFHDDIARLKLNQKASNVISESSINLVSSMKQFLSHLINDDNGMNTSQALDMGTKFVCDKLSEHSSNFKRARVYESNELYVPPQQLSLGVRWDMVKERNGTVSTPTFVQCKYQYVSITQTIVALFQREDFCTAYRKYNESSHTEPGVYNSFQSGSAFASNELFKTRPESLQIEIGTDDFEVCNPLGSKSTLHKICAVYFTIKNVSPQHRSKLDNIFLVALCNSDDLKTKFTDFNDIWRVVVRDISQLESGVYVGNGMKITGTLVHLLSDNLGANIALGFVERVGKSSFYCRFCDCNSSECKTL